MALGSNSNKIYLSVADGKVVQKSKEGVPGAQPRTKKDGAIIWEMRYAYITGLLTNISTRTNTYAGQEIKEWVLDITDGQENSHLQIMFDSRYATSLIKALANPEVDFSQPITITPWMKMVDDKKKTSCYVKQGEQNINWFFTKEDPNGLPDLEKVVFKGKEVWDSFNQMQFLENYVQTHIKPQLSTAATFQAVDEQVPNTPEYADPSTYGQAPDDDDLPF